MVHFTDYSTEILQYFQGDDTGLIGESPYIGRARYKANRFAQESEILGASPSQVQIQSVPQPGRAEVKMELTHKLDHEIAEKKQKVAKGRHVLKNVIRAADTCSFMGEGY